MVDKQNTWYVFTLQKFVWGKMRTETEMTIYYKFAMLEDKMI